MYLSVCISQMLPEKLSLMLANFYLFCLQPHIRNEPKSKTGKFAFQESMWAWEKNLEPPSAWNCCTQTCSADGLGSTSIWSLSFLYRTDGETPLARKKGTETTGFSCLPLV